MGNGDCGFAEWPHAAPSFLWAIKNPHDLSVAAEAVIGLAGVLLHSVGNACLQSKTELV